MANKSEGTGGSAESFDISRNDERKSTDTRMSKESANLKTGGGAEVHDLEGEEGQVRSGYRTIRATKPVKAEQGGTPADPAAPKSPGHIMPDDGPTATPLLNQGVKR